MTTVNDSFPSYPFSVYIFSFNTQGSPTELNLSGLSTDLPLQFIRQRLYSDVKPTFQFRPLSVNSQSRIPTKNISTLTYSNGLFLLYKSFLFIRTTSSGLDSSLLHFPRSPWSLTLPHSLFDLLLSPTVLLSCTSLFDYILMFHHKK